MYYHQIDFFTQSRFFFISFGAGLLASLFSFFLCSKVISKKIKIITDIIFCLICVLIIVCTNIAFEDAALRLYELIAFISALLLMVFLFKKRVDMIAEKVCKSVIFPIFSFFKKECKIIINKLKSLLKKIRSVLYNLLRKLKEHFFTNAKSKQKKQKKESEPTSTA